MSPPPTLSVAVVGWGMAGPAVALALARQGHRVTAFERVPDPQPVGAGILLQPTGMAALATLGQLAPIAERGAVIEHLRGLSHRGRVVMDLSYADLAPGLFGLGMHRGVIFQVLDAAARGAGVQVRTGVEVAQAHPEGPRWRLSDGAQDLGAFHLVLVADGARSTLRGQVPLRKSVRPYPWGALWRVHPDPDGTFPPTLHQVYRDTRQMLGFLPTGLGPTGTVPQVSLFWSVRLAELDAVRRAGLSAWREQVLALDPRAALLLEGLSDLDELLVAPYLDVTMPRRFALTPGGGARGGLAFLGDAAHAMSPQLGQGTNLALLDAVALAAQVEARPGDLPAALAAWDAERSPHLRYYQLASRWLTPVFQSRLSMIGPLRDLLFAPLARVPWLRRRMLDSLAGVRTGVFSTLPLPGLPAAPVPLALPPPHKVTTS